MKLILGGYGVMGRVVEGLALERGHDRRYLFPTGL